MPELLVELLSIRIPFTPAPVGLSNFIASGSANPAEELHNECLPLSHLKEKITKQGWFCLQIAVPGALNTDFTDITYTKADLYKFPWIDDPLDQTLSSTKFAHLQTTTRLHDL